MDKPKLRWIEAHPVVQNGQDLILLSDSEGIVEEALVVSRGTAYLISLMDGTRTVADIGAEFMRASGELIDAKKIQELVDALDGYLFLQSEKFRDHYRGLRESYERSSVRAPCLAGKGYAANRMDLLAFLDEMLADGHDGHDGHRAVGEITGMVAPHIDYSRGMEVYKKTYPYLRHVDKPLVVILGTCHHATNGILAISLKDFETPIEVIPHARGLDKLILDNHVLRGLVEEWPHRREHSIELQLPLIQFMVQRDFEILPILTGSMDEYVTGEQCLDNGRIDEILASLRQVLNSYGKPYIVLAGADLAHIGAQFGDTYDLDSTVLARSRARDGLLLQCVTKVDAEGFFNTIKEERDERRICGLTPIYLQLKLLAGDTCDIIDYGQWSDGKSSVSFAGGVFYKA